MEIKVKEHTFSLYIGQDDIDDKVSELAFKIEEDYHSLNPIFLVVLNGAFRFAGDLATMIDFEAEWQFVKLSSYQGMESSGKVKISDTFTINLENRHIVVVEDIVDTGNSMTHFLAYLRKQSPASIKICSLLVKPEVLKDRISIDYVGFPIPNKFVIGYGLDYDEKGRNLDGIWQVINPTTS